MTLYFKITSPEGRPVHGGTGKWNLPKDGKPGKWRSVKGDLVPCRNGLHLLRPEDICAWLHPGILWEAEAGDERVVESDKVVVRKARLVRQAAVLDDSTLRLLAADFAEHVLPIFEKRYPEDKRPREAIAAARAFARGEITREQMTSAAYAAYAAYAASAASAYAARAAADAARAAAYAASAAYASSYAARQQERQWQSNHVIEVLGLIQ